MCLLHSGSPALAYRVVRGDQVLHRAMGADEGILPSRTRSNGLHLPRVGRSGVSHLLLPDYGRSGPWGGDWGPLIS